MSILYSNLLPLATKDGQETIDQAIHRFSINADKLTIAVGYVSVDGLTELDQIVRTSSVNKVILIVGMYVKDGIPESIYHKIKEVQSGWQRDNLGEIRMVKNMAYHGKSYLFWRKGKPFIGVIGSCNLSVLVASKSNQRQYELAVTVDNETELEHLQQHIGQLVQTSTVSANDLSAFKVVHEKVRILDEIPDITQISEAEKLQYFQRQETNSIVLPIEAPLSAEKFEDDGDHHTRSGINVCYKPRKNKQNNTSKERSWYEVQIPVPTEAKRSGIFPLKDPFIVVTEDGYKFEVCTTSQRNKQISAYSNETSNDKVFGRWIKGRLAQAGYVKMVAHVDEDIHRNGMITQEMLDAAGMRNLVFTKTDQVEYGYVFERLAPTKRQLQDGDKGSWNKKKQHRELLPIWTITFSGGED